MPGRENLVQAFPTQLNIQEIKKEKVNTEISLRFFPEEANPKEPKRRVTAQQMEEYREYIRENIG